MRKTVELLRDEEQEMSGVEAVSLVKFPAIETDFVFFSKDVGKKVEFAVDEEKRMVIGCLLYTSPSPRDRQKYRMPSSA